MAKQGFEDDIEVFHLPGSTHENGIVKKPPIIIPETTHNVSPEVETLIPITKYQDYFNAIIRNDVKTVDKYLKVATAAERDLLIHSCFDFEDQDFTDLYGKSTRAVHPFHLSICFSSPDVARLFLRNNVNAELIDTDGKNLLHCTVVAAFYNKDIEEDICDMIRWLENSLPEETMKSLIHTENRNGLRPLELAAQQGTLLVFETMLHLKIYVAGEIKRGFVRYRLTDITEYELGERNSKSPMLMLAHLHENKLEDENTAKVIQSPLVSSWINGEIKSNLIPILGWISIRAMLAITYFLIDTDTSYIYHLYGSNTTDTFCNDLLHFNPGLWFSRFITFVGIFITLAIMIFDICMFIRQLVKKQYIKKYNLNGKKKLFTTTRFFFVVQWLFLVLYLFCSMAYLHFLMTMVPWNQEMMWAGTFTRVFLPVLLFWSLMYFMQLLPLVGPRIIGLQTMVVDMGSFLVLLALSTLLFVHVFETFLITNSKSGCVTDFKNPYHSTYSIFLMMLNMYGVNELDVMMPSIFEILHIVYACMVGIMLINFLIAVMSESANKIAQNEIVILKLNQLAIAETVQERIYWMIPTSIYRRLRRFGFYCDDKGCYLRTMVDDRRSLYESKVEVSLPGT